MGADMRAETAAKKLKRPPAGLIEPEAEARPIRMEGYRCKTRASRPLDAIRRARDTPILKLEPSFCCRSYGTRRHKPPVQMIKLTKQREIRPCKWVHPDEER